MAGASIEALSTNEVPDVVSNEDVALKIPPHIFSIESGCGEDTYSMVSFISAHGIKKIFLFSFIVTWPLPYVPVFRRWISFFPALALCLYRAMYFCNYRARVIGYLLQVHTRNNAFCIFFQRLRRSILRCD